jgi:predicted dehydrogenase
MRPRCSSIGEFRDVSAMQGCVAELYAEFAKGEAAGYPVPDFAAALTRHRLLDAIERSAASGCRVTLS